MPTTAPYPAALPKYARLAASVINAGSGVAATLALAPTAFAPGCMVEQLDTTADKMLGTRTHSISGSVDNLIRVRPSASLKPAVAEWANLLQWCLHGVPTGTTTLTYPLADRENDRTLVFDDTQRLWTMFNVAVNSATFAASAGGPLTLDVDCVGVSYAVGLSSAFPAGLTFPVGPPFMMINASVAIGGTTAVPCRSARLTVNNDLDGERFFFGPTISGAVTQDRTVEVTLEIPYGLSAAVWAAGAGAGGVAVTLTFTRGPQTLVFTMPTVRAVAPPPQSQTPAETFITWTGQALSDTTNAELSVALTP